VYDMEVPELHNFIAGEIVVHNSLEQDASIVLFPRPIWSAPSGTQLRQFPENIDPATNYVYPSAKAIPIRIYIKKNRNGATGVTGPVKWIKSTNTYQTLTTLE
jgi:replicative DNA helicase